MILIGWMIRHRAGLVHNNVKIYRTKGIAERYAGGEQVKPVYIMEHDEE